MANFKNTLGKFLVFKWFLLNLLFSDDSKVTNIHLYASFANLVRKGVAWIYHKSLFWLRIRFLSFRLILALRIISSFCNFTADEHLIWVLSNRRALKLWFWLHFLSLRRFRLVLQNLALKQQRILLVRIHSFLHFCIDSILTSASSWSCHWV